MRQFAGQFQPPIHRGIDQRQLIPSSLGLDQWPGRFPGSSQMVAGGHRAPIGEPQNGAPSRCVQVTTEGLTVDEPAVADGGGLGHCREDRRHPACAARWSAPAVARRLCRNGPGTRGGKDDGGPQRVAGEIRATQLQAARSRPNQQPRCVAMVHEQHQGRREGSRIQASSFVDDVVGHGQADVRRIARERPARPDQPLQLTPDIARPIVHLG